MHVFGMILNCKNREGLPELDGDKTQAATSWSRADEVGIHRHEWSYCEATAKSPRESLTTGSRNLGRRQMGQTQEVDDTCLPRWEIKGSITTWILEVWTFSRIS